MIRTRRHKLVTYHGHGLGELFDLEEDPGEFVNRWDDPELADLVPHERLNSLIEKVRKSTALAIIKQVHREVEAKMALASDQAETRLRTILAQAEATMRGELGAELERLEALRAVNPSIREEELDHLRYRIEECAIHIQHANLQLQALRLIITT